jgi:hypothetical protein
MAANKRSAARGRKTCAALSEGYFFFLAFLAFFLGAFFAAAFFFLATVRPPKKGLVSFALVTS